MLAQFLLFSFDYCVAIFYYVLSFFLYFSHTISSQIKRNSLCLALHNIFFVYQLFSLSFEDFDAITSRSCFYCGENEKRIGIDRIDNSIGYTKENSVSCCKICNYMKRTMTKEDFLNHIKKIYLWITNQR